MSQNDFFTSKKIYSHCCWNTEKVINTVMHTDMGAKITKKIRLSKPWLFISGYQVTVSFEREHVRAPRAWWCWYARQLFSPLPLISQGASPRLGKHVELFLLLCKTGSQHKHFSKVSCNMWHLIILTAAAKYNCKIKLKIFYPNNNKKNIFTFNKRACIDCTYSHTSTNMLKISNIFTFTKPQI